MVLRSWVALEIDSHFPIQNLPYGVFSSPRVSQPRIGVAIGEYVLDLVAASKTGPLSSTKAAQASAFEQVSHNKTFVMKKKFFVAAA